MFILWYIASSLLIINTYAIQPLCIDSCSFDLDFDANLTLPINCTTIQRDKCSAILTFNYATRIVKIQFGSYSHRRSRDDIVYTSEIISDTIITLDDESSTQNIVEYYCSQGDFCELGYVVYQALSIYIPKTCHHFRANLISLLHSDPLSSSRSCMTGNEDISKCIHPCHLFSINPNETLRACDNSKNLEFQTTIGRTTPMNKPEYNYRLYSYTCTTELCNGFAMQQEIERLIQSDDGECLVFLEDRNQTTYKPTTIPHNQAISYSKISFVIIICCLIIKFVL